MAKIKNFHFIDSRDTSNSGGHRLYPIPPSLLSFVVRLPSPQSEPWLSPCIPLSVSLLKFNQRPNPADFLLSVLSSLFPLGLPWPTHRFSSFSCPDYWVSLLVGPCLHSTSTLIHPSIYPTIHPKIHPSIHPSNHPPIYPFNFHLLNASSCAKQCKYYNK